MKTPDPAVHQNFYAYSFLWILGTVPLMIWGLWRVSPFYGETHETYLYMTMGSVVPALIFCLYEFAAKTRVGNWLLAGSGLAGVALVLSKVKYAPNITPIIWKGAALIALLHGFLTYVRSRRDPKIVRLIPVGIAVSLVAMLVASQLHWWEQISDRPLRTILAISLISVITAIFFGEERSILAASPALKRIRVLGFGLVAAFGVALLFQASSRTVLNAHDAGWLAGPMELVRQGYWLLWNIPSQYGFLNIAFGAALPGHSGWQSLYLANGLCIFISGLIFWAVWFRAWPTLLGAMLSLCLMLMACCMMPGFAPQLVGVNFYPQVGPLRFIWCYILLGLVIVCVREADSKVSGRNWLFFGTLMWVLGCFWSFESMFFSIVTWLPAYGFIAIRRASLFANDRRQKIVSTLAWLALPLIFFAGAVGLIYAYYLIRLGHNPDWMSFIEYAIGFKAGPFTIPIGSSSPFPLLVFLLGFSLYSAILFYRHAPKSLPIALSAMGMSWAAASYFILRSHPNNITNIFPMFLLAFAAVLVELKNNNHLRFGFEIARYALAPLLIVIFVSTIGNFQGSVDYVTSLKGWRSLTDIDRTFSGDPDIKKFLDDSGVLESDSLVFIDPYLLTTFAGDQKNVRIYPTWLPISPPGVWALLGPKRRQTYLERSIPHMKGTLWLLTDGRFLEQSKDVFEWTDSYYDMMPNPQLAIQPFLEKNGYRLASTDERYFWKLLKFERSTKRDISLND